MSTKKTVFITGASAGIGLATALHFQQQGWNVVATMRNPDAGKDLLALENLLVLKLDVTDPKSIDAAVASTIARFGSMDVLVNNAGYGVCGVLEVTPIEAMRRQFETNVIGLLAMTKAVIPTFRKQHSGVIVNISSIGGRLTLPLSPLYSGTKFAVEGISESLAYEMSAIGVRVKVVEPGMIATNFRNALEFHNEPSISEYQPVIDGLWNGVGGMVANAAGPELVAKVIYTAATDGTAQLRYTAGEDARQLAAQRASEDDNTFFAKLHAIFGL